MASTDGPEGVDQGGIFDDPARINWALDDLRDLQETAVRSASGGAAEFVAVPTADMDRFRAAAGLLLGVVDRIIDSDDGRVRPGMRIVDTLAERQARSELERELNSSEERRLTLAERIEQLVGAEQSRDDWVAKAKNRDQLLASLLEVLDAEIPDTPSAGKVIRTDGSDLGTLVDVAKIRAARDQARLGRGKESLGDQVATEAS